MYSYHKTYHFIIAQKPYCSKHGYRINVDRHICAQVQILLTQKYLNRLKIRCFDQHDIAISSAQADNDGRRRSDDLLVSLPEKMSLKEADKSSCLSVRLCLCFILKEQFYQTAVWRVKKLTAKSQFLSKKAFIILCHTTGHSIMFRVIGLYDNTALFRMTASPPGCLCNQHEASLRSTKIRHIETGIRTNHTYCGNVWNIVSFRHHLCAEQDVIFAATKALKNILMRKF